MKRTILALLLAFAVCGAQQLRGVNYGIQKPDGSCTNYDQVLADFKIMATFAQAVKIYNMGFCSGAQNSIIAARATGLKLFLGMAAGPPDAFQNELNILKSLGSQYGFANVIGITVGSEDLYRQSVAAETIANYIQQVQAALKTLGATVPVTHTDVYYLQPASILNVEDIVMMNAFSFWEGVSIENALSTFVSHYESLKAQANGKTVWIGESGWPAAGATQANAVASPQNAGAYAQQFICWANANGVPYFYFEAFDEPWKGYDANGAIEVSFGLYNSDRTRKSYFNFQCPGTSSTTSNNNTPAPTTAAVDCSAMFSTLSCTTSSEDPSKVDKSQVDNAQGWLCSSHPQYCADIVSGGKYSSCNSVEKVSYAMSQYYNANGPSADACSFGGLGHVTGGSSTNGQVKPTTSAQVKSTTSANTPQTSASAATSAGVNCAAVFSTLSCTTSSEDPSQVDKSQVDNAQGWLCSSHPQYCADIVSGGKYSSCNSVEKVSYAMSQYYNANGPSADACSFGGLGHVTGNSAASPNNEQVVATTSKAAAAPTSSQAAVASTSSQAAAAPSTTSKAVAAASTTSKAAAAASTSGGDSCQTASFCGVGLCNCNGACYKQSEYCCPNGNLVQKQFC